MERPKVLIIDDAEYLSLLYKEELLDEGYDVDIANSFPDASELIEKKSYDLMIVEIMLKCEKNYREYITILNNKRNEIPVIINTGTPLTEIDEQILYSFQAYTEKSSDLSMLKDVVKSYAFKNKFM